MLSATAAMAEIYRWVDEHGNSHFTDTPPKDQPVEQVEVKVNTYTAVKVTPLSEQLGRKDKVVMYSASWCSVCKAAKKYFKDNRIAYVAYDVENNRIGRKDYKFLKGKSVPIILIGDARMNGFNSTKFEKLYAQQMAKKPVTTLPVAGN